MGPWTRWKGGDDLSIFRPDHQNIIRIRFRTDIGHISKLSIGTKFNRMRFGSLRDKVMIDRNLGDGFQGSAMEDLNVILGLVCHPDFIRGWRSGLGQAL